MDKNWEVGDKIHVVLNGKTELGRIRRIGTRHPSHKGFVMLTLDIGGNVAYTVAQETEVADKDITLVARARMALNVPVGCGGCAECAECIKRNIKAPLPSSTSSWCKSIIESSETDK